MRTDIRPLSLGDIFDEAFELYRRNFGLLVRITAVILIPAQIGLQLFFLNLNTDPPSPAASQAAQVEQAFSLMGAILLGFSVYSLLYLIQSAACTVAASERYLERPVTARLAYRAALRRAGRLTVTAVLIGCIFAAVAFALMVALGVVMALFMGAAAAAGSPEVALSVGIAATVLMLLSFFGIAAAFGMFLTQIVTLEGGGYVKALHRNLTLVKGQFGRAVMLLVMLFVFVQGFVAALAGCLELALHLLVYRHLPVPEGVRQTVGVVISALLTLFAQPLWAVCVTVFYYDRRVRQEGFDVTLMLRGVQTRQAEPEAATP